MRSQYEQNELDEMRKNPDNYKWGIFYFNPNDPRCIIPRRNIALGVSLNFANPYSYLIILGFIAFAVIMGWG